VPTEQARAYAEKNSMTFFEVSPLCNFNVIESFTELSRIVLMRHGMEKFWRPNRGETVFFPLLTTSVDERVFSPENYKMLGLRLSSFPVLITIKLLVNW